MDPSLEQTVVQTGQLAEQAAGSSPTELAIPAFIALVLIEVLIWATGWSAKRGRRVRYDARDSAASMIMGFGNVTINAGVGALVIGLFAGMDGGGIFNLGWTIPVFIACFFLEDLSFYWSHRLSHEVRWFWASHVVHHSSQHYNLTTALRQNWTDMATGAAIFYVPIVLIGFPIEMIIAFRAFSTLYQFWIHTEAIDRMPRWFEAVMNTPAHHRVHHATNPEYLDRNYAGVLIIWDRLFGTFAEDGTAREPIRYGIIKNIGTYNPLKIATHEWAGIIKDVRKAKSLKARLAYVFARPGWSETGDRKTTVEIKKDWQQHLDVGDRAAADATASALAAE